MHFIFYWHTEYYRLHTKNVCLSLRTIQAHQIGHSQFMNSYQNSNPVSTPTEIQLHIFWISGSFLVQIITFKRAHFKSNWNFICDIEMVGIQFSTRWFYCHLPVKDRLLLICIFAFHFINKLQTFQNSFKFLYFILSLLFNCGNGFFLLYHITLLYISQNPKWIF